MPEDPLVACPSSLRQAAVTVVGAWLSRLPGAPRPIGAAELSLYARRGVTDGWRLDVQFPDGMRRLDLLIGADFPRKPPKVVLVDRPEFLTWPHVEEDGVLCVLPESAEIDFSQPVEVARNVLALACELVDDLSAGLKKDDFRKEFNSYWNLSVCDRSPTIYSLLDPAPPPRLTRVWRGRNYYLVGDEQLILAWLRHRFRDGAGSLTTQAAAVLWLEQPLLTCEFPRTAADVLAIAQSCGGSEILERLTLNSGDSITTVIGAPTVNGPCFAGITIPAPNFRNRGQSRIDQVTPGFRPGKAPRRLLLKRYLGGGTIMRSKVERADASWVHGRGQDTRFARLREATVAVLGCGSIGAPVALQLAGSGVGRFLLIDPDLLTWANVGRHPLGAAGVGFHKVEALAERIRTHYPHILGVDVLPRRWQDAEADMLKTLASCDLIISAMGDWAAEGRLNEWHLRNRQGQILYGWTEAHACAGHGVAILPNSGCFQCGFTHAGTSLLRVTEWPQGHTLRQEPACGAVYQPYGPVELGHVVAVIGELAIDCLLGSVAKSTHRIWAGRRSLLKKMGGKWTLEWTAIARDRLEGGFVEEREWPRMRSCIECAAGAA